MLLVCGAPQMHNMTVGLTEVAVACDNSSGNELCRIVSRPQANVCHSQRYQRLRCSRLGFGHNAAGRTVLNSLALVINRTRLRDSGECPAGAPFPCVPFPISNPAGTGPVQRARGVGTRVGRGPVRAACTEGGRTCAGPLV